jgi:hypothetical protein
MMKVSVKKMDYAKNYAIQRMRKWEWEEIKLPHKQFYKFYYLISYGQLGGHISPNY